MTNQLDQDAHDQLVDLFGRKLDELLANFSEADTVGPHERHKLKGILSYYAKKKHPFTECVTADTPVDAPRDMELHPDGLRIDSLRKGDLVWSFDEDERCFVLKPVVWAAVTRRDAELVAVALDNGKTIRCTPDHPFMLRNGRWVDAGNLRPGDSLMPLYRDFEPRVRLRPDRPGYTAEHDVVAEAAYGSVKGLHVHHADRRRANVSMDNIEALTNSDHSAAHHRQWDDAVALRDEEWRCSSCDQMFTPIAYNQKKCAGCQGYQKRVVGKKSACAVCSNEYEIRSPNQRYCSKICRHRAKDLGISIPGLVGGQTNLETWNHKVVEVQKLDEREDVWDIEVMDTHTFVSHGVVIHNCVRDNTKRFGPDRAARVCATLKDIIWGTSKWRGKANPVGEGPHPYTGMSLPPAVDLVGLDELDFDSEGFLVIEPEIGALIEQLSELDLHELMGIASQETA